MLHAVSLVVNKKTLAVLECMGSETEDTKQLVMQYDKSRDVIYSEPGCMT